MKKLSALEYIRLSIIMVVIYCYLERDNDKFWIFK